MTGSISPHWNSTCSDSHNDSCYRSAHIMLFCVEEKRVLWYMYSEVSLLTIPHSKYYVSSQTLSSSRWKLPLHGHRGQSLCFFERACFCVMVSIAHSFTLVWITCTILSTFSVFLFIFCSVLFHILSVCMHQTLMFNFFCDMKYIID